MIKNFKRIHLHFKFIWKLIVYMVFQLICSISVVDGWRVCLNTVLSTVSPSEHNSNLTFLEQVTIKAKEDKEIFDKKFVASEKKIVCKNASDHLFISLYLLDNSFYSKHFTNKYVKKDIQVRLL